MFLVAMLCICFIPLKLILILKGAVSRDFLPFFISQAKMVLLKNSFLRRYSIHEKNRGRKSRYTASLNLDSTSKDSLYGDLVNPAPFYSNKPYCMNELNQRKLINHTIYTTV